MNYDALPKSKIVEPRLVGRITLTDDGVKIYMVSVPTVSDADVFLTDHKNVCVDDVLFDKFAVGATK